MKSLAPAFVTGMERVSAWADLIDAVNVFPVADGDTGRNLAVSLSPLKRFDGDPAATARRVLQTAVGNSGNIAARFFSGFFSAFTPDRLDLAAKAGRDAAWASVPAPRSGTMLTFFDALSASAPGYRMEREEDAVRVTDRLAHTVSDTIHMLPELERAGVVDAGALGMFVFFEGFFFHLAGVPEKTVPLGLRFGDRLRFREGYEPPGASGRCVTLVVRSERPPETLERDFSELGDSIVIQPVEDRYRVHLHPRDASSVRDAVAGFAAIVDWADEEIKPPVGSAEPPGRGGAIHVMTDAAGSLCRDAARNLGVTLLDSYVVTPAASLPETACNPPDIYRLMVSGVRVTTAQASDYERRQRYQSVLTRFGRCLYLPAGSVYTGNHRAARDWKKAQDDGDRLTVIDTGAASGRLAVIAIAVARKARKCDDPEAVIRFAEDVLEKAHEFVFIDRLKYLAASGRLSRTGAFFGDFLHVKPVITPAACGVKKIGTVTKAADQIAFAMKELERLHRDRGVAFMLLEYTDNWEWVEGTVLPEIETRFPETEVMVHPLSLTSGVHMGPGTWGLAVMTCME